MHVDLVQLVVVTGAWSGALMTLALYLHSRRVTQVEDLSKRVAAAEARAVADHAMLRAQIQDIALTTADNYVRQREFNNAMRLINETSAEIRKDVGAVHNRIDELFRQRWSPSGD